MGCTSNKSNNTKAKSSNIPDNTLLLRAEICSSWGFSQRRIAVEQFAEYLKSKGETVITQFEAKGGGNGEYFVYASYNGKEKIVFSNNKEAHKDAVIGFSIAKNKFDQLIQKINKEVKNWVNL